MFPFGHATASGHVPAELHVWRLLLVAEHFVLVGMQSVQAPATQALLGQDEAVVGQVPSEPQVRTPFLSDEHCVPGAQVPLH